MADTAARTLRLLNLLQRRRFWTGADLAAQLAVSERTLRRDVQRLRELGYAIATDRGVGGGYQLASTDEIAPVLIDNDEAVVLAVGLTLAAQGSEELAEVAVGTLSKLLPLLPPAQRRRAEGVRAATATAPGAVAQGPPLDVLAETAAACRDGVRLSFHYTAANGARSDRYVEPYGLVALGARHYLVAFDLDRDDWRTFRLDRSSEPRPTRNRFTPRPLPAADLHDYIRTRLRGREAGHQVVVEIDRPAAELSAFERWLTVEEAGPDRCRASMQAHDLAWPLWVLAAIDAPFTVVSPPELRQRISSVAERFTAAVS